MMTNLFSIFDPSSFLSFPLNWVSSSLGLFFIPWGFWVTSNRLTAVAGAMFFSLHQEFKVLVGSTSASGHTLAFVVFFVFISGNNFLGLFPYVFTASSHLVFTLSLALPMWVSFMVYGWVNHTKHMLAHMVPLGTPGVLMPFMVLIETVSNIIRPGTLAVRLAANMIAGHLLLVLLGSQAVGSGVVTLLIILGVQVTLLVLEGAVAVIQSYVFAVLATLYSSEVN